MQALTIPEISYDGGLRKRTSSLQNGSFQPRIDDWGLVAIRGDYRYQMFASFASISERSYYHIEYCTAFFDE
jgi:hypothetical protein